MKVKHLFLQASLRRSLPSSLPSSLQSSLQSSLRRALQLPLGLALLFLLGGCVATGTDEDAVSEVNAVIDGYHSAAAAGDWPRYFDLMSPDGVFIGTDANERWGKTEFQAYASNSNGWIYTPQTRNVVITPDGRSAWFDEILLSQSFGTSRGSGILIMTDSGWKISQYHLTIPLPNSMIRDVTDQIKQLEAQ